MNTHNFHNEPVVVALVVVLNRVGVFVAVDVYAGLIDDGRPGELLHIRLLRKHLLQWHRLLRLATGCRGRRWVGVLRRYPHVPRVAIHCTASKCHWDSVGVYIHYHG